MRLKRAMTLKAFRRRGRFGDELDDDFGARRRRRRRKKQRRQQKEARRRPRQRQPKPGWSDVVPLGENIRIQARDGYRGAYVEIRPGLYVVAELRTEGLEGEFGRKVRPQDVASEIFRVSSQALNTFMPRQQAQRQQAAAQPTTSQALPAPQAQRALPAPQQQYATAAPTQQYAVPQQYAAPQQQYAAPQQQYATAPQQQAPPTQVATTSPQTQPAQLGPQSFLPPAAARWISLLGDDDRAGGR